MKQERLRILGALVLIALVSFLGVGPAVAQAKLASGKLAGVVRDVAGTPQMGASVELISEATGSLASHQFLTNTQGIFRGDRLPPGFYTLRVTLAGFLPTLEKHVRISPNLTTVVRIQLESMFASLDQLRRAPAAAAGDADDWKWVLRSASSVRPVLEWVDAGNAPNLSAEAGRTQAAKLRLEFTDGASRVASPSNIPPSPATAVAYDQDLGGAGKLILAAQASYDDQAPSGGFATVWLPKGSLGAGPHTALVLREAKVTPDGRIFRGVRLDQDSALAFGDHAVLRYGAEYALVGLGAAASSLRPRAELDLQASEAWTTALIFAAMPAGTSPLEGLEGQPGGTLAAALNELDAFPTLLWRGGHPVMQSGWHEEISAERKFGARGKLQVAGFHDDYGHVAVFGHGTDLPAADYFQDYFSNGFAYDGGASSSWGSRVALREKLDDTTEISAIYSFGGALAPSGDIDDVLRDMLRTVARQSFGTTISAKVPRLGTKLNAGYKWVSGPTVSRVDSYGESLFQLDPYFHLGVRQPLPKFTAGRWEAIADCDNLLAQGYVSATSKDGRVVLVPAFRTFRGGLSVQF